MRNNEVLGGKMRRWLSSPGTTGVLLVVSAAVSLLLANSPWGAGYQRIWSHPVGEHPLSHWIDDGLMALFFLLVGLELKSELLYGTLKTPQRALVPLLGAIGGMVVPVAIYLAFNVGESSVRGFGIPMATDIAFVLAVVGLLGRRVPPVLKVFLTTLAVVDDLGAVVVIALFYTGRLHMVSLVLAMVLWGVMVLVGQTFYPRRQSDGVLFSIVMAAGGVALWLLVMKSGVHGTVSGLLLAMALPTFDNHPSAPAQRWLESLWGPVYGVVLPLFILSNTAIPLERFGTVGGATSLVWGIGGGLLIGKPVGILAGVWAALHFGGKAGWEELTKRHWIGAACLGGIGFTMALFVAALAFDEQATLECAKAVIVVASTVAALLGGVVLATARHQVNNNSKQYTFNKKSKEDEKVHL